MLIKYSRVNRPRAHIPILPQYDPNAPGLPDENLRGEREAYRALFGNNSWPCYPIELGFEASNSPGQYKDLFSNCGGKPVYTNYCSPLIFSVQLERWKRFRQFQQKNRRYLVIHSRFPEFQGKFSNIDEDMNLTAICNYRGTR